MVTVLGESNVREMFMRLIHAPNGRVKWQDGAIRMVPVKINVSIVRGTFMVDHGKWVKSGGTFWIAGEAPILRAGCLCSSSSDSAKTI
jgi:hypothetical protein